MTGKVFNASFNSSQDAFVIASDQGVRVFNGDPPVLLHSVDSRIVGSVKISNIVARSNLVALVGSGVNSKFPQNICFIYDMAHNELVYEITLQGGPILNVLMTPSRLIVVLEKRVQIFEIPDPCTSLRVEETRLNINGLAAVSGEKAKDENQILVYPGFKLGSIQILNLKNLSPTSSLAPSGIEAHQSEIAAMCVSYEGTIVATGSSMGTVLRVWNTRSKRIVHECRRGTDPSTLHILQFSPCSSFLAASSDKGTIHVFSLEDYDRVAKKSFLQQMAKTIGKNEKRSCAQIPLEPQVLACGFIKAPNVRDHALVIICADGTYHKFTFNLDGHVNRVTFDYIMLLADEQEFWSKPL